MSKSSTLNCKMMDKNNNLFPAACECNQVLQI